VGEDDQIIKNVSDHFKLVCYFKLLPTVNHTATFIIDADDLGYLEINGNPFMRRQLEYK